LVSVPFISAEDSVTRDVGTGIGSKHVESSASAVWK
jgi:hypothetical protein